MEKLSILTENRLLSYDLELTHLRPLKKNLRFLGTYNQMNDVLKKTHEEEEVE